MAANVESKTRCADLRVVAALAASLGAEYRGLLEQVDTYFRVGRGRLKLREITHHTPDGAALQSTELIRYERPDQGGARVSLYERTQVADAAACRTRLEAEHGLRGSVRKCRDLWTCDATRIHLDHVEGLGDFVELETVSAGTPTPADRREHDRLATALGLDPGATVDCSYIDLIERE